VNGHAKKKKSGSTRNLAPPCRTCF
jgi:hypothetical protein